MILLTLLTMTSWAEAEVAKKEETTAHVDAKEHKAKPHKMHNKHGKTTNSHSDHDIDESKLSKYSTEGLKGVWALLKAAIARNEVRDQEDLENRLAYQKKRGGTTPCGASYAGLSMTHFLNVIEDETREMEEDMKAIEKELKKRGHKCGCKSRG